MGWQAYGMWQKSHELRNKIILRPGRLRRVIGYPDKLKPANSFIDIANMPNADRHSACVIESSKGGLLLALNPNSTVAITRARNDISMLATHFRILFLLPPRFGGAN